MWSLVTPTFIAYQPFQYRLPAKPKATPLSHTTSCLVHTLVIRKRPLAFPLYYQCPYYFSWSIDEMVTKIQLYTHRLVLAYFTDFSFILQFSQYVTDIKKQTHRPALLHMVFFLWIRVLLVSLQFYGKLEFFKKVLKVVSTKLLLVCFVY